MHIYLPSPLIRPLSRAQSKCVHFILFFVTLDHNLKAGLCCHDIGGYESLWPWWTWRIKRFQNPLFGKHDDCGFWFLCTFRSIESLVCSNGASELTSIVEVDYLTTTLTCRLMTLGRKKRINTNSNRSAGSMIPVSVGGIEQRFSLGGLVSGWMWMFSWWESCW